MIQARLNSELFDLTKNHVVISGYDGDMMRIEWQYIYIYKMVSNSFAMNNGYGMKIMDFTSFSGILYFIK